MKNFIVFLAFAGLFVVLPVFIYNRLIRARNEYRNAFAQIQVQLKRRHDLIPNLVTTVEAYLKHEKHTLEAVTQARNHAASLLQAAAAQPDNASDILSLTASEQQLTSALRNLNVAIEAYPELHAEQAIRDLHEELAGVENRVAFARQAYNDAVMEYNNARETFPASLFADFFGHKRNAALLQFEDHTAIQQAPRISLNHSGPSH